MTEPFCISLPNPTNEQFDALSEIMENMNDSFVLYAQHLARELGVKSFYE